MPILMKKKNKPKKEEEQIHRLFLFLNFSSVDIQIKIL